MPQFLFTPIFVFLTSLGVMSWFLWKVPPYVGVYPEIEFFWGRICVFLVSFFLGLTSFFSLILFCAESLMNRQLNPRIIYRSVLRKSFILSLGGIALVFLFLTKTANFLTGSLLLAVVISLLFTLKK